MIYIAALAYGVFMLLSALIGSPSSFPEASTAPRYVLLIGVVLVCLAVWARPRQIRSIFLAFSCAYLPTLILEISSLLSTGTSPTQVCLWASVNVLISFLILGSRWGAALNALTLVAIFVTLLLRGPLSTAEMADWLTVCLVLVTLSFISYLMVTFIESNLLAHEQDSEKLRAARQDALTAVYGRGAIGEELERAMAYAQKHNTPMSVIVTDIDHFKSVNDQYGHATGDDVLRAIAKRLRRAVGGSGMVGRWGGEEFIILLPGLAKPEALVVAERLRREIYDQPLADLSVTASFGVASYRGVNDTTDHLFGRADQAMYEAKKAGRNAVR
ncbi:GGDEF domain-containing protein [Deinococcus arenicola]|uniref:GGDEF domain-containing protein n=1 Tax=Deinococcus arenicola TaxID=2994950 RepID=A0ABU4DQ35_9DEIO|nr:GGDEF domain-containing protein [Deinococcus sp. ZS9-10]MDV6373819.1 GGDEF domain-containing protein [Deinococcus sp. ZS9-10]